MSDLGSVDTERSRAADEVVARLERLPTSRFHVHLAAMLGVGTFFDAFDALTIASALPVIFVTLHIGFVNSGILLSSGFASAIVGAAGFGLLSELLGRKFAYVSALFLFGAATIATGFAQSWQQLLALRIVQELGIGGELPVAAAMMNEFIRGRTRGRVGGIYQSLFAWGTLLSPVVSLFILSIFGPALGWRVIFWVGGVTVPLAIYAIFRLPESPRWLAEKGQFQRSEKIVADIEAHYDVDALQPPEVRSFRADVKRTRLSELFADSYWRRTVLVWTQFFMYGTVLNTLGGWLPTVYAQVGHVSTQFALVLTIAGNVVTILVAYVFAGFSDHVGRRPMFVLGFGLSIIGAVVGIILVSLHAPTWPVLLAAALLMLMGAGILNNGTYLYTAELFPTRMRSWATSTGHSMNRLGGVVGPTLLGVLVASAFGIRGAYVMFLIAAAIGLAVVLGLGIETKQRVLEELSG